jgi:hypothetical protein
MICSLLRWGRAMSLRAIAFHESISVKRLAVISESEFNQVFAGAKSTRCNCGTAYALFLPQSDDPQNDEYVADLAKRISADCNKGKHSLLEIRLERKP